MGTRWSKKNEEKISTTIAWVSSIHSLNTQIRNIRNSKSPTIVFLGLDNSGKSSIINYLRTAEFRYYPPTIKPRKYKVVFNNEHFDAIDVSGSYDFRRNWSRYIQTCNCLVYVIDSTDKTRFHFAWQLLHDHSKVIEKTPTLVLLNKQDDENSMDLEECTTILKQNKFIEKIPVISVHACSAVNGTGLKESFKWLVDAYRNSESNV